LPYFKVCLPCVVRRALLTGFIMVRAVSLLMTEQSFQLGLLHVPSVVRLSVYPFNSCDSVISVVSIVTVGTMCSP
jgi:hypothetical protein